MMDTNRPGPLNPPDASHEHRHVWAMLPWIANGSAGEAQREQAAAHLAHCADCRAELQAQQRVQSVLAGEAPAVSFEPGAGLQRLLGRIDAPLQEQPLPAAPARRKRNPLVAAMAAALVVQAIGLGVLSVRRPHPGMDEDFRTLSQAQERVPSATLLVVPAPSATLAEWHALLQAEGLRIVSGPNTVGAYELAPAPGAAASAAGQLERLRQAPGVRMAEPITRAQ